MTKIGGCIGIFIFVALFAICPGCGQQQAPGSDIPAPTSDSIVKQDSNGADEKADFSFFFIRKERKNVFFVESADRNQREGKTRFGQVPDKLLPKSKTNPYGIVTESIECGDFGHAEFCANISFHADTSAFYYYIDTAGVQEFHADSENICIRYSCIGFSYHKRHFFDTTGGNGGTMFCRWAIEGHFDQKVKSAPEGFVLGCKSLLPVKKFQIQRISIIDTTYQKFTIRFCDPSLSEITLTRNEFNKNRQNFFFGPNDVWIASRSFCVLLPDGQRMLFAWFENETELCSGFVVNEILENNTGRRLMEEFHCDP
ncbi:MAG: hypothetical protein KKA07_06425 [Bacteroidetes bacterium]|nr:hypothetical protein [Bacteroidota bacterium]MBU1718691.1 hypothetical protein [Bacteroidota bacterium]